MPIVPPAGCGESLLAALTKATAAQVLDVKDRLLPTDFNPAEEVVFRAVVEQAQRAAQHDDRIRMDIEVINNKLVAQGAMRAHDTGVQQLMLDLPGNSADPFWIKDLADALILDSYHRAYDDYAAEVAANHPQQVGLSLSDAALRMAEKRLETARQRLDHTATNQNTRETLHV